jgi:hypothetical protein
MRNLIVRIFVKFYATSQCKAKDRLVENIGAAKNELSAEDLTEINSILEDVKVLGERYPEELEKRTGL